jgi:hypothetical protein
MPHKPKPPLRLAAADDVTWGQPTRKLDNYGRSLWDRIMREYDIRDAGGVELLLLACKGIDCVGALREEINRDGAVVRLRNGSIREHPALKAEVAIMSFVTRTLARLGLDVEPVRASRPPLWSLYITRGKSGQRAAHLSLKLPAIRRGQSAVRSASRSTTFPSGPWRSISRSTL